MKKKQLYIATILLLLSLMSCTNYLDIAPNNQMEESDLFSSQDLIERTLTYAYSEATPNFQDPGEGVGILYSDEIALPPTWEVGSNTKKQRATNMNWFGLSPTNNDNYCYWNGSGSGPLTLPGQWTTENDGDVNFWKAIRQCDFFLQNIDNVQDNIMTSDLSQIRKGEALFIKAWSYFCLLRQYGPIPIIKTAATSNTPTEEMQLERRPYDECVEFISNLLDQSAKLLPPIVNSQNDLGRATKPAAYALKSRLLLYAASPLFNGNSMYASVKNHDGLALFNPVYDVNKWKLAAAAADSAIFWAELTGHKIYNSGNPTELNYSLYPNPAFELAKDSYRGSSTLDYNLNTDIIWGYSTSNHAFISSVQQLFCLPKNRTDKYRFGYACFGATLRMAELFYTENGLPIDEDNSYPYDERYNMVQTTSDEIGKIIPNEITVNLNLKREPRFYGALAFDRGYYKCQGQSGNTVAFDGAVTAGYGFPLRMRYGDSQGQQSASELYYSVTGYIPKRNVHFLSADDNIGGIKVTIYSILGLPELYLNKAEALNEFSGPSDEVYNSLNKIRERAGIPTVQDAWGGVYSKDNGKYKTQDGLRDIIQQERSIELMFEQHRIWDLRRWLKGDILNSYVSGWKVDETTPENYYQIQYVEPNKRVFTPAYYLFPIPYSEILKDKNLVQNYGY